MKLSSLVLIFIWGTLFSAILFVTVKYDSYDQSLTRHPVVKDPDARAAAGMAAWHKYGCNSCHRINGEGNRLGPDLSRVGVRHDQSWLHQQLGNPNSHNSNSAMSSYASITQEEMRDLVDYLSGLRGTAE